MKYTFRVEPKDGYLHVRVQGENTPAVVRRYLKELFTAADTEGCPNVLLEEDLVGPRMAIGDIFAIVSEKSGDARPRLRLIAFVDVNATTMANMKFAENVAVNRGITVSAFATVADAEKWLRKKLAKR